MKELEALRELMLCVTKVCEPIFTASDGGDMWCVMRNRTDAKKSVERLKSAIKKAALIIQSIDGKSILTIKEIQSAYRCTRNDAEKIKEVLSEP